jgi:arginine decarboxylase-like protein
MYVYKILNLQNIIEPETSGEKTYFYVQNKYVVSTNQDISGDNAVELLDLTDELKQELYTLNPITEFSTVLEKQFFIEQLVSNHTMCIKEEAYRRITIVYPITKQLNLIYEQADKQAEYTSMVEFIANIRLKSNELESQIAGMSVDELSVFDCSDAQYWQ